MILCPHCSGRVPPNLRFCPHCGKRVDVEFEQIKERLAEEKFAEDAARKERESRKLLIIAVLLFLIGVTLFYSTPEPPKLRHHPVWTPPVPESSRSTPDDWLLEKKFKLLLEIPD